MLSNGIILCNDLYERFLTVKSLVEVVIEWQPNKFATLRQGERCILALHNDVRVMGNIGGSRDYTQRRPGYTIGKPMRSGQEIRGYVEFAKEGEHFELIAKQKPYPERPTDEEIADLNDKKAKVKALFDSFRR